MKIKGCFPEMCRTKSSRAPNQGFWGKNSTQVYLEKQQYIGIELQYHIVLVMVIKEWQLFLPIYP